jgi:NAD(P)H dehydrogenase (quinone)
MAQLLADDGEGGDRQPSANELDSSRFQGAHLSGIARASTLWTTST